MRIALVIVGFLAAGCAARTGEILGPEPTGVTQLRRDYRSLADCSYRTLTEAFGPGWTKTDLESEQTVVLALTSSGIQYFNISLRRSAAGGTIAEFASAKTLSGPFPGTDKAIAALTSCDKPAR
jgi:hypothetical protein